MRLDPAVKPRDDGYRKNDFMAIFVPNRIAAHPPFCRVECHWDGILSARGLQHEGFHQFARIVLRVQLPPWVNEGLAEYFERAIIVRGRVKLGIADQWSITRVRQAVRRSEAMDLDEAGPF